jgi:hypothetical protein
MWATPTDKIAVSDRGTLRGLTQCLRRSVSVCPQTAECKSHRGTATIYGRVLRQLFQAARKSLILNGEMSEWSLELAWKNESGELQQAVRFWRHPERTTDDGSRRMVGPRFGFFLYCLAAGLSRADQKPTVA